MKTLKEFIEDVVNGEFDEKFVNLLQMSIPRQGEPRYTDKKEEVKDFLRAKLTECATLTVEAVKRKNRNVERCKRPKNNDRACLKEMGRNDGYNLALTEIENKR